jgi:hypothetical protein
MAINASFFKILRLFSSPVDGATLECAAREMVAFVDLAVTGSVFLN